MAIATNIPQRLKIGFVVQGHKCSYPFHCECSMFAVRARPHTLLIGGQVSQSCHIPCAQTNCLSLIAQCCNLFQISLIRLRHKYDSYLFECLHNPLNIASKGSSLCFGTEQVNNSTSFILLLYQQIFFVVCLIDPGEPQSHFLFLWMFYGEKWPGQSKATMTPFPV